ncbi:MAG: orotidine 5'-phosphate decarboxylase [Nitrososphaerales archaeon]|nr:orotidine 5'-phosphate decarboxylase [Nitrososphaerales archaeon]
MVLALDFTDPFSTRLARARSVLDEVKGSVAAVKVNHHLLLPFGLEGLRDVIAACKQEELPLIADLKMNDVESTNLSIVNALFSYGFDAVIANPFVGYREGLGRAIAEVHSLRGGVLLLVYMSHAGAREGYSLRLSDGTPIYRVFAKRARDWGADGVIVSAKSPRKVMEVRNLVGAACLIFSPGVGAQGGSAKGPIPAGADFLIVGRSITGATNPRNIVRKLNGG